ncbi:AbrB/MazE/SpoVT family DNA-binding domain-containing protein [Lacticaseibacillus saniviri]|uniref:AbrB/MazE/SpoVT family DNA-binding domain-containing protein n=1 Tax=Lacticaseibacillus saniviri TaxID=931533 RepID=UPI0006D10EC6|nr:AbrB/MazE/SpoVT family DNA-binding domain-containing protein [Lacticaseibacillus saniviri]
MEVKISKWGNSQGIRLPLSILRQMGMTNPVGESVSIEVDSHGIAKMKKTKKRLIMLTYSKTLICKSIDNHIHPTLKTDWTDKLGAKPIRSLFVYHCSRLRRDMTF